MAEKFNWQEDYECWFCSSDDLLEDMAVTGIANANGLLLTIEDSTYKITKPDSKALETVEWVIESKQGSDLNDVAKNTTAQSNSNEFKGESIMI